MRKKMNAKNLLVSFLTIASVLLLVATVSAADFTIHNVKIDNVNVDNVALTAGDNVEVEVKFSSNESAKDVVVKIELDDKTATRKVGIVIADKIYKESFVLKVPSDFDKDEVMDSLDLEVEIDGETLDGEDFENKVVFEDITVHKVDYNPVVRAIMTSQNVDAGESFAVDIIVQNDGFLDLDDLYITASIPALGVEKTSYFGDLVAIEDCTSSCDDDDEDTVSGRLYLETPYETPAGVYALEIEVRNDDTTTSEIKNIVINNDFASNVIVTSTSKTVAVGANAEYDLLIVNPTNKVKVYRVVTESSGDLTSSVGEAVIAVPAGTSKTVRVSAKANTEGTYSFNVNVFAGEALTDTVTLSLNAEGSSMTSSPIVVLTVILAVIFLVLLIVLIVLIGKKPARTEEFGESYY